MNTILQNRIEEAAFQECSMYDTIQEKNAAYNTGMKIAKFALQNQWISVGEALPEKNTICFVRKETELGIIYDSDYIDFEGKWFFHSNRTSIESMVITHWIPIPEMKGGKE